MKGSVPEPVLLRIPMYIQALKRLVNGQPGRQMVSTT